MAELTTIQDIARQAGVSVGTVSQALNNKPGVSQETRARVLQVAESLGYQHKSRISVSPEALSTVGLVVKKSYSQESASVNPFYSQVLMGVARESQRQNMSMMYAEIETDGYSHARSWPALDQRIGGILIVGISIEEPQLSGIYEKRPVVLIDSYLPGQGFDSVITNNAQGLFSAVQHLVEMGHRHIGLIGSIPGAHPSILERRQGYLDALHYYGLTSYIEDSNPDRQSAHDGTVRLLKRAPQITAIIGCNDQIALAATKAANELGLHVPEDISIVGFDNIDIAAEVRPALTTVAVDKALLGVLGVQSLLNRYANPDYPAINTVVGTRLIQRDSVRALDG
jgi:DNA-binding LacI/PurR family transcriptional regulator